MNLQMLHFLIFTLTYIFSCKRRNRSYIAVLKFEIFHLKMKDTIFPQKMINRVYIDVDENTKVGLRVLEVRIFYCTC